MSKVFEPLTINRMTIKNRFVRSATMDNQGKNGTVAEKQLSRYQHLARGEVGLIISSGLFPHQNGQIASGQIGIHKNETIPSLRKLVKVVHKNNGKIAAQLMHAGWFCRPEVTGSQPAGPSAIFNPVTGLMIREFAEDEIYQQIEWFIQAGQRALEAGFDAIELHGAHNWLISSFLSPATNQRRDEWGGSPEKRIAFVQRIYEGIRKVSGPDYPIFIKLGLKDYHPRGKTLSEGICSAKLLEQLGIDAIEVSEGLEEQASHHIRLNAKHPYYIEECCKARRALKMPLILVGGMRKLQDMESILSEGIADAVSMCRPFIRDPYIVKKFRRGISTSSECVSCNGCIAEMRRGTIRCVRIGKDNENHN